MTVSIFVFQLNHLLCFFWSLLLYRLSFSAGNKSDRIDREITQEQGWKFAQENDMPFLETSAKNSNNIDKLFLQLAKTLLEAHIDKTPSSSGGEPSLTVTLKTVSKQASEDKGGCCS